MASLGPDETAFRLRSLRRCHPGPQLAGRAGAGSAFPVGELLIYLGSRSRERRRRLKLRAQAGGDCGGAAGDGRGGGVIVAMVVMVAMAAMVVMVVAVVVAVAVAVAVVVLVLVLVLLVMVVVQRWREWGDQHGHAGWGHRAQIPTSSGAGACPQQSGTWPAGVGL